MSNLLPPNEKTAILHLYRKRFLVLCLLTLAGLALAGSALLFPSLYYIKSQESVFAEKRDELSGQETNKIAATLATTIADINARLNVFSNTAVASPLLGSFIDPVLKIKTNAVHITNFAYARAEKGNDVNIQVSGTTDSRADLLLFADKMKTSGRFANVNVPIASFIKDSNVTFTITASLVPAK